MFTKSIGRTVAAALILAPAWAHAGDDTLTRKVEQTTVSVNAGQGGFVSIPIVRNEVRTYALTGTRSADVRLVVYRTGQGEVLIRAGN